MDNRGRTVYIIIRISNEKCSLTNQYFVEPKVTTYLAMRIALSELTMLSQFGTIREFE